MTERDVHASSTEVQAPVHALTEKVPLEWHELTLTPSVKVPHGNKVIEIESVEQALRCFGCNVKYEYERTSGVMSLVVSSGPYIRVPHIYLRQQQDTKRSRVDLHRDFCNLLQQFLDSGWDIASVSDVWSGKRRSEILPRFNELCSNDEFPEGSQSRESALVLFRDALELHTFVLDRVLSPENNWPDVGRLWAADFDPFASLSSCEVRLRQLYPEEGSTVFFEEVSDLLKLASVGLVRYKAKLAVEKGLSS